MMSEQTDENPHRTVVFDAKWLKDEAKPK
jgi:hypothetical protein